MTVPGARSGLCSRARRWISLQADGELSELEHALLAAHLRACSDCAAFAADVPTITAALRLSPLEQLSRPIELPLRRRAAGPIRVALAGTAVAAIALLAVLGIIDFTPSHASKPAKQPSSRAQSFGPDFELQRLRTLLQTPANQGRGPF